MTPEQIEFHRKRFDEVCGWKSEHVLRKDSKDILFQGYLMAIESIEIEKQHIPMSCCINSSYKKGFDDCNDRFIESIQSLGLKVREW